jgi:hypothetical protein
MDRRRLEQIEEYVLCFFKAAGHTRVVAQELFDSTSAYANADLVRALESLEKTQRLLVRHTTDGTDYLSLTQEGAAYLGVNKTDDEAGPVLPHPPKSATRSN